MKIALLVFGVIIFFVGLNLVQNSSNSPSKGRSKNRANMITMDDIMSLNRNTYLAFDTNVLIEDHTILSRALKNGYRIIISERVRKELDGLKNSDKADVSKNARLSLKSIIQAVENNEIKLLKASRDITKKYVDLDFLNDDDEIIASYLNYTDKCTFITNDLNARFSAKNVGMAVLEKTPAKKSSSSKGASVSTIFKGLGIMTVGAVVFLIGWKVAPSEEVAKPQVVSDGVSYSNKHAMVSDSNEFSVLTEFDDVYVGSYSEKWGGFALVDFHQSEPAGRVNFGSQFLVAMHIPKSKEISDYRDYLKVMLHLPNESIESNSAGFNDLGKEEKLLFPTSDAKIKVLGTNAYLSGFFGTKVDANLEGATIEVLHKVTGEVIYSAPIVPNTHKFEKK